MNWKSLAILFMIIFVLENSFIIWGYSLIVEEEDNTLMCYYEICEDYSEALYEDDVCFCYGLDVTGTEYIVKKTEILK